MFDLNEQIHKLQQLKRDKIHGLPYRPKQYDAKVKQMDGILFETKAEQEHTYMLRSFRNHSIDFGRRLSKRKGQYHKPGGGYAGHTIKG